MSADPPSAESRLKALQCHFTWDLDLQRTTLLQIRDKLIDINPDHSNPWLGHIYNLQAFIQHRLGFSAEALQLFTQATEAFRRIRHALEGPWLLVNYGNLAWLHHELGQEEDTETYLSNIQTLTKELPVAETEDIHPEVLAEKAWSLMKFSKNDKLVAAELFEKALEMEPDRVEWRSSQAVALLNAHKHNKTGVDDDILRKVKMAHELDTENLYIWADYLNHRAKKGEDVMDEVSDLVAKILENPLSSYSGFKIVLRICRQMDSQDAGIFWAEEALENHPESRYLKRCLALCYKWRIVFTKDGASNQNLVTKALSLLKEVIALYPDACLVKEIDLADLYAKLERSKAGELYQELVQRELDPRDKQMVYNRYAKYLLYTLQDVRRSIKYHKMVASIDHNSFFKDNSIETLKKLKQSSWEKICAEIKTSPMKQKLEELQCHFTWQLERSRSMLYTVRDRLQDISPQEDNIYEGYSYNLQGFVQYKLGFCAESLQLFTQATEAFRRIRPGLEGPWLLVNYGNLAWLHHDLGQQKDTETYLSKIQALTKELPTAETEDIHPEVLAEKAWSLMEFYNDRKLLAADLFEKALEMEPDRVEWRVCQVLALVNAQNHRVTTGVSDDVLQKMKLALDLDPNNFHLMAEYLNQRATKGEDVKDEAIQLASKILSNPSARYNGIKTLVVLYRSLFSVDAALDLAKNAVEKNPKSRNLKNVLTTCYKWKIVHQRQSVSQDLIDSATCLLTEVISLYPDSCLTKEIELANMYAKSNHSFHKADQLYQELLQRDLEPSPKQMLYNFYAKFLNFEKRERNKSTEYHIKAAEIPIKSYYRANSIQTLRNIRPRHGYFMGQKIDNLLANIPEI